MERAILHCDLNAFFASVELLDYPELRQKPVAVCGDPKSRKGIILAKNDAAKAFGVKTAETLWQAQRKCPELILLPAHREKYHRYSKLVNEIYGRYTDLVEPFGIDESWLDLTGTLHLFGGDASGVADEIRGVVRQELGLTISVGVSFNKIFAKLGSDMKKPDATTVISRDNFKELVWPLPVSDLLFVGRTTANLLKKYDILTIGQLAHMDRERLVTLLGKHGAQLHSYATGQESSPVHPVGEQEEPKSIGNGSTFRRNLQGRQEAYTGIAMLAEQVGERLRRHGLEGTVLQVTVRSPSFEDRSRQRKLDSPTNLTRDITRIAMSLLEELWDWSKPIRALTVTASGLLLPQEGGRQLDLFHPEQEQQHKRQLQLEQTVDELRGKFGKDIIRPAMGLGKTARELRGEEETDPKDEEA